MRPVRQNNRLRPLLSFYDCPKLCTVICYQIEWFLNAICRLDINASVQPIVDMTLIVGMIEEASIFVRIPLIKVGLPWLDGTL